MKKIFLPLFLALVLGLATLFSFAGCDLSHKHYTDAFGVCRQCQKDVSITATKDVFGNYVANNFAVLDYSETIIKFVASGESGVTITIDNTSNFCDSFTFYKDGINVLASSYNKQNLTATYNFALTQNTTYYVKIKANKVGTASIIITPN